MRDVHDPDLVSWWPPALGWWILAAVVLALLAIAVTSWWVRRQRARDWRVDARFRMRQLGRSVRDNDPKTAVSELSDLLRRVAIARYGRGTCAGLAGDQWLDWLTENDPAGFDWRKNGRVLLDLPYMPAGSGVGSQDLRKLVAATKRWVKTAPDEALAASPPSGMRVRLTVESDR